MNKELRNAGQNGPATLFGDFNQNVDVSNSLSQYCVGEDFVRFNHDGLPEQYAKEATSSQAIIDLVLRRETGIIDSLIVKDPLGRSDHSVVEFIMQIERVNLKANARFLCMSNGLYNRMVRA
ncbi:hypothetical protein chiPu_0025439 [Chiloscyllium punctatum]|uniref:Endonuclease/exonuclease/phosphatase domain-containing protein n=1 Tax=Chiloscyllium punctatum TaxID=137246 RepID=A0A401TFH4_CHIPU|nr:hypothetical protein [Chiloscyllium punctatum]